MNPENQSHVCVFYQAVGLILTSRLVLQDHCLCNYEAMHIRRSAWSEGMVMSLRDFLAHHYEPPFAEEYLNPWKREAPCFNL